MSLSFKPVFKNCQYYDVNDRNSSYFNCIYYKDKMTNGTLQKINVFAIMKTKSSVSSPIYNIAYDSDEFSKDDVLSIIYEILTH